MLNTNAQTNNVTVENDNELPIIYHEIEESRLNQRSVSNDMVEVYSDNTSRSSESSLRNDNEEDEGYLHPYHSLLDGIDDNAHQYEQPAPANVRNVEF